MKVLKQLLEDLTASYIFIPLFVLSGLAIILYWQCFVSEYEILSFKQNSQNENIEYQITATCRPVDAFTSAPFISIRANGAEIFTAKVNQGYDLTGQCLNSSIESVRFIEAENKVQVLMKNKTLKETVLIYNPSK